MKASNRTFPMSRRDLRRTLILISLFSIYITFLRNQPLVLPESALKQQTTNLQTVMPQPDKEVEQLWGRPERIVPLGDRKADNEIRYASFGSSVTWGAGLADRDSEAYINLLSKEHGDNYGIRASGPNYPASCISSMIGDNEYDVIILEYFMAQETGMMTLAQRLRERFPDAIIIILKNWYPGMLWSENLNKNMHTWVEEHGFGRNFIHDDNFHKLFIESGPRSWILRPFKSPGKIQYEENVAKEVGAHISPMLFIEEAEGPDGYLEIGRKFMADDSFHQSAYGHANIAMRVMDIVDRVGVPKSSRIGTFHDKDHCDNWLQSGVIGDSLTYGDTFKILKMPNTEKYTLELTEGDSGWVKINNQADHPMRLYIGYMTTSPAPFVYPVMEARLEQTDLRVILEPSTIGYEENQKVHVPRLGDMGMVDPGEATIFFEVVEKAERPFRLVQTILTVDKPGRENLESGRWMEKTS